MAATTRSKATKRAEVEAIRASRPVMVTSRRPWCFKVESTEGDDFHRLRWSEGARDVICDSCMSRFGRNRCWARARCLDYLRQAMLERRAARVGDPA